MKQQNIYFQETEEMAEQTSHDNGFWDFLRKRGVAEENIDRMQQAYDKKTQAMIVLKMLLRVQEKLS